MAWDTGTGLPSAYIAAIEEIAFYFDRRPGVDALLLTGSWARGKGDAALGADCDLTLLHNELFDLQVEMAAYEKWVEQRNETWQFDHLGPYTFIEFIEMTLICHIDSFYYLKRALSDNLKGVHHPSFF